MPPKKKEAIEEDDSTPKIFPLYKRKCEQMGVYIHLPLKALLDSASQQGVFDQLQEKGSLGPLQARALFETLMELNYSKFKIAKFWKSGLTDEGVRNICRYLDAVENNSLQVLDLLENDITKLGCQFLGKSLSHPWTQLQHVKLDNNPINSEGLKHLSVGLSVNPTITKLSLKNCGIDAKGAIYLQAILANISSRLRSLKLQGNNLTNEGIYLLLRAIKINEVLEKINIADTGLNLLAFKAKQITKVQTKEEQQFMQSQWSKSKLALGKTEKIAELNHNVTPENPEGARQDSQKEEDQADLEPVQGKMIKKVIQEQDSSLEASIMRLLFSIMSSSLIIKKYDLRFNPISDDASNILFEAIEDNGAIKDVQLNNNVDASLRDALDTLMRKRTGRMPKGRGGAGTKKKKKKK